MSHQFIKIGFLTTNKKSRNKQIRNLVDRLDAFGEFSSTILSDLFLDNTPVRDWPIFDICIPYHLDIRTIIKAKEYIVLRNPIVFNDLEMQEKILSRKFIYDTMKKNNIPCLDYLIFDHKDLESSGRFFETEDYIEVNGKRMAKPFVEKPLSARRHDIHIYYNKEMGSGVRKLFRKMKNNSSKYYPNESKVRRDGAYLYERFIDSKNDVKVYAVLQTYSYAETRKSPNVDGIVERNSEGFEIREYCPLTYKEANISKKVISVFKQNICGFDIIRENKENSYVIDVNGMSFVKYNLKYYDDVAHMLRGFFLSELKSIRHPFYEKRKQSRKGQDLKGIIDTKKGDILLGVVTFFRHGDRTAKQKVKVSLDSELSSALLRDLEASDFFKGPNCENNCLTFKKSGDFKKIRSWIIGTLEKGPLNEDITKNLNLVADVLKSDKPGTKLQIKLAENGRKILICKWGGNLTQKGVVQCERYARNFKKIYKGLDDFGKLTKTSRVYASDELRVKQSARIFVDTLIGKKESLIVQSNKKIEIFLNQASKADFLRDKVKLNIDKMFNSDKDSEQIISDMYPDEVKENNSKNAVLPWVFKGFKRIVNPKKRLEEIETSLNLIIRKLEGVDKENETFKDYKRNGEGVSGIVKRWKKIWADFRKKEGIIKASAINDMYDNLQYDLTHNFEIFKDCRKMYSNLRKVCGFLAPAEYGITKKEKKDISKIIVENLLLVILKKMELVKDGNSEHKTFFFFGSESFLHSLRNLFLVNGLASNTTVFENFDLAEFNFLSHVIIRLYEDTMKEKSDKERYYVNIMFSPGVWGDPFLHIDQKNYRKDKREILNPLVSRMAFSEFRDRVNWALS